MKVLFVNQTLSIGGAETLNKNLLTWLSQHNCEVTAYTTNLQFKHSLEATLPKVHQIPLVIDLIGDWKGFLKGVFLLPMGFFVYLHILLSERDSNVILMTGFIEKIYLTPLAKLMGIPVVWIEFANPFPLLKRFLGLPKIMYDVCRNLPSTIVVPSRHTLQSLPFLKQVQLIPLGIDLHYINKLSISPKLVCCVSRLEKGKGQDLLIKAWQTVVAKVPNAKLRIVGTGSEYQSLQQEIDYLKLDASITLVGWVSNAIKEISECQVFAFPSIWSLEGFGLVSLEAMALGKPVVGFSCGPLPEVVDNSCGILVPSENVSALANALIKLLRSPQKCIQMGKLGRDRYHNYFTLDIFASKFLKLISTL